MKELSLNVLDIAQNSVKAGAKHLQILIEESPELLTMTVIDDGCGMTPEILRGVTDPFYTTRTTRRVGLGLPLLKLAAEQTGGEVKVESKHESLHPQEHGTTVSATFYKTHIDFTPMGDIIATVTTLIQGNPDMDLLFRHTTEEVEVELDTEQMRQILGEDVPLNAPEIIRWAADYLREQYENKK